MAAKYIQYPNINNSQAQNCAASCSNRPTGQKADHLLANLSNGVTKQSAPQLLNKTPRCLRPAVSLSHSHLQHQGAAMRTELDVPFSHKEEAKALGAKWDRTKKIWYVPSGVNPEPFAEWLPGVDRSDPSAPYIYLVLGKRECWKCHKETSVAPSAFPIEPITTRASPSRTRPTKPGTLPSTRPTPTHSPSCPLLAACRARSATTFISAAATSP